MNEIKDMSFDEFITWATGFFIVSLGQGNTVHDILWSVLNNFLLNWLPSHGYVYRKPMKKRK